MLQAADRMRVHVREPDILDKSHKQRGGHGLCAVEQRPNTALLFVRFVQSRIACKSQERMDESRHDFDHHSCRFHCGLCIWMLCIQESQD